METDDLELMSRGELLAELAEILESEPGAMIRVNLFLQARQVDAQAVATATQIFKEGSYRDVSAYRAAIFSIVTNSEREVLQ